MKRLTTFALILVLSSTAGLWADDKKDPPKQEGNAAKLLGKWEVTKATDDVLVGGIIVFEKDGKFTITLTVGGQEMKIDGTYKLEKDKLTTEAGGGSDIDTIKKLTDDAMELENKDGKVTVLKKKK